MLSDLETTNVINVPYSAVAPFGVNDVLTLDFPTTQGYEMVSIRSTIAAAAAIVLPGLAVFDDNGTFITTLSILPWQFAGTTITTTTGQTPDVSLAGLFGPNLGSYIMSGLHVFSGWQLLWGDFLLTPGVVFEGVISFSQAESINA